MNLGLAKTFNLPWSEKHHLQLRWDVFNVANHKSFGLIDGSRTGSGVARDPALRRLNPPDVAAGGDVSPNATIEPFPSDFAVVWYGSGRAGEGGPVPTATYTARPEIEMPPTECVLKRTTQRL